VKEQPNPPLVSVVIPCYKQAHFLPEAIESTLSQTHGPIEVIVVDDGSPDTTAEVVARYPEVRYLRQENRGLGGARNGGFRISKGEYILFLDADDRLTPNAVEAHLSCFAKHPDAGFVVGDIDNIALDGSYLGSPRWPLLEGNVYEDVLKVNHVANSIAVMWRRSMFEQLGGFQPSCSPAEDIELLLRAARLFRTAHHRTTVAQYRRYPNTLSRKGELMLPAIQRIMRLQNEVVKKNPVLLRARRRGYAYWRDYFGKETLKELFAHVVHGSPRGATMSLVTLLRYVGGRPFIWPWKYRQRGLNYLRRCLRARQKRDDRSASTVASR
jgi:glycosyltransferase involved in cell wall biosynthesis